MKRESEKNNTRIQQVLKPYNVMINSVYGIVLIKNKSQKYENACF